MALASWIALSLVGFASPVEAKSCATLTLGPGIVSPGSGAPSTTFTFSLTVVDKTGATPAWVRVQVNGSCQRPGRRRDELQGRGRLQRDPDPSRGHVAIQLRGPKRWDDVHVHRRRPGDGRRGGAPHAEAHAPADAKTHAQAHTKADPESHAETGAEGDTQAHAETVPKASQGDAQTDSQARIDRLAEIHRSSLDRTGDRQPRPSVRTWDHADPDADGVGDAATTCRRCDRPRIRWRRLRRAERRRERPHRRLHQPVGRLAHDDGRRCVVLPVPRAAAARR